MVKSPTPRCWRCDCSYTKDEEIWIIKQTSGRGATALRCLFVHRYNLSNHHPVPHKKRLRTARPALQRHRRCHRHQSGEDTDCCHAQEHRPCASIFRGKSHQEHRIGYSRIRYQLLINSVHSSSGAPFQYQYQVPSTRGPRSSCAGPPWLATQC